MAARRRRATANAKPKGDGRTKLKGTTKVMKYSSADGAGDVEVYDEGTPVNYKISETGVKLDFELTCGEHAILELTRDDAKGLGEAMIAAATK